MATVNTNDSRIRNAQNLVESFNRENGDARSYVFIGRATPWDNEEDPPKPVNNYEEFYETYNEMLSLKRINDLDVRRMIPRISWTTGVVYDMYRHDYSIDRKSHSNATTLFDSIYYVLSQNQYVYVCLYNNENSPSTVEPQNISNKPFFTSDGYQWLKLFRVNQQVQDSFSTNNLIPVVADDYTWEEPGGVHTVMVNDGGTRYTNNPDGPFADVLDYYCKIVGDGEGAVAKVRVRYGSIQSVGVVRPGKGYSFAKLDFVPGRVYQSLTQLDEDRNGLNPLGDGRFNSTVIISPPGGWGYMSSYALTEEENNELATQALARQLSCRTVGVFSSLKNTNLDFFTNTSFRQIGILRDFEYTEEDYKNNDTLSAVYSLHTVHNAGPHDFIVGEQIEQYLPEPGVFAIGKVVSWDSDRGIVRYIHNKETVDEFGTTYHFGGTEVVHGLTSKKFANVRATFDNIQGIDFVGGYAIPEIKKYTGYLTYLTNIKPVVRVETQTERISLTITF